MKRFVSIISSCVITLAAVAADQTRDPLPSPDECSAKGLQFDCMVTKTNFLVGEPVYIWCAVTNTTDSSKPLIWASESSHFIVAHDETTWFEGFEPRVTPQLRDGIKSKPIGYAGWPN